MAHLGASAVATVLTTAVVGADLGASAFSAPVPPAIMLAKRYTAAYAADVAPVAVGAFILLAPRLTGFAALAAMTVAIKFVFVGDASALALGADE